MGEAIARLRQLHGCFERAKKRLESLPESGLSEAGQPYIEEVAETLQSFAAWFGELTFDHCSITGPARRVFVALTAFDAIVDWVGLHRSQEFALDLAGQMAELVEQSEALDDTVTAAFLVERSPTTVTYRTSNCVPQEKQDAIEDGIQSVASLAGHLGVRLQRIALMAGSSPEQQPAANKPPTKPSRKGIGGPKKKYPPGLRRKIIADRKKEERKKNPEPLKTWLTSWATKHEMTRAEAKKMYDAEKAAIRRAEQARSR